MASTCWLLISWTTVLLATASTQGTAQQDSCRSETFPPKEQFLLGRNVDHLEHNANNNPTIGHLVIVPEMRFNCHGYITGWSALLSFDFSASAFNGLVHDITFQLWRPSPRDSGIFTFVGSSQIRFVPSSSPDGVTFINGSSKYFNLTSVTPSGGQNLRFQPGDVMGWYFHTRIAVEVPLSVAYRHFTTSNISSSDPRLKPVDVYTTIITDTLRSDTPPPCELSLCSDQTFTRIPSVIPYLTVDYMNTTEVSVETQPACVNTSSYMLRPCDMTTTSQISTTSPSRKLTTSTHDVTIASTGGANDGLVVGIVSAVIALIAVILIFTCTVVAIAVKLRRIHTAANQAYDVTDEDPYSYPEVVLDSAITMETNLNEAYGTNMDTISADPNVAYFSTNMAFQENEAYNVANTNRIVTQTNEA